MKEAKNEYELVVSEGKRALWQTIIAAGFYTVMLYYIYNLVIVYYNVGICYQSTALLAATIKIVAYTLSGGLSFSVVKTVLIDTDTNKLISRFNVGPFSHDIRTQVPQLEYVAVFLDGRGCYEVNLWYNGNKHYSMFLFDELKPAFKFAAEVSEKLKIDILNSTVKGDFHMIDKEALNEIIS